MPRHGDRRKPQPRPCVICGKPTGPVDQNSDGTWAHTECLRPLVYWPPPKGKRDDRPEE